MKKENQHRKLEKHFYVIINNKKVKILNFKIEDRVDDLTGEVVRVMTIITKIQNEILKEKEIQIQISTNETDINFKGKYKGEFSQPGLKRYLYVIEKE
ncbi:hypothetical protein [Cohnella sp. WQ 127256]|uniref:hypothetical protein n=1 Tax=Cohnella sp. WQ 127256 TaxID=2938790 RepID=UPI002117A21B|nr:hypothetical protein [Cohnella sp. WQ 127256]